MARSKSSRSGRFIKAGAWGVVALGAATPLLRHKLKIHPVAVLASSFSAPLGLAVAAPRSKIRDAAIYALQMWAYFAAYEMPNDNPEKMAARVRVEYPIKFDRLVGLGEIPTVRVQPPPNPGHLRPKDYALTWSHWLWYLFPHSTVVYTLVRRNKSFPRTAAMVAAVFDLGAVVYYLVPTAPPWIASEEGRLPMVRRIMVEVGERTWGRAWEPVYKSLSANPVAAMPSLHFGTSVIAARMLQETGPLAGAAGWSYTLVLGYGLVYLGEHYVIDLLAGMALAELVRKYGPVADPLARALSSGVKALQEKANS